MVEATCWWISGSHLGSPKGAESLRAARLGRRSTGGNPLETGEALWVALLEKAGVALGPGGAFGLSPWFRPAFAAADEDPVAGTCCIAQFLAGTSG